eukprot:scaffold675092_cov48-Prasinocladus_malaysianus.AAC.1
MPRQERTSPSAWWSTCGPWWTVRQSRAARRASATTSPMRSSRRGMTIRGNYACRQSFGS